MFSRQVRLIPRILGPNVVQPSYSFSSTPILSEQTASSKDPSYEDQKNKLLNKMKTFKCGPQFFHLELAKMVAKRTDNAQIYACISEVRNGGIKD